LIETNQENYGVLLVILRGFALLSNEKEMILSIEPKSGFIPALLIKKLVDYVVKTDSSQIETGHLIFEFIVKLLKH
jgi:hypothetical protein